MLESTFPTSLLKVGYKSSITFTTIYFYAYLLYIYLFSQTSKHKRDNVVSPRDEIDLEAGPNAYLPANKKDNIESAHLAKDTLTHPVIDPSLVTQIEYIPLELAEGSLNKASDTIKGLQQQYEHHIISLKDQHIKVLANMKAHYETYIKDIKQKALQHILTQKEAKKTIETEYQQKLKQALDSEENYRENLHQQLKRSVHSNVEAKGALYKHARDNEILTATLTDTTIRHTCKLAILHTIQAIELQYHKDTISQLHNDRHAELHQHVTTLTADLNLKAAESKRLIESHTEHITHITREHDDKIALMSQNYDLLDTSKKRLDKQLQRWILTHKETEVKHEVALAVSRLVTDTVEASLSEERDRCMSSIAKLTHEHRRATASLDKSEEQYMRLETQYKEALAAIDKLQAASEEERKVIVMTPSPRTNLVPPSTSTATTSDDVASSPYPTDALNRQVDQIKALLESIQTTYYPSSTSAGSHLQPSIGTSPRPDSRPVQDKLDGLERLLAHLQTLPLTWHRLPGRSSIASIQPTIDTSSALAESKAGDDHTLAVTADSNEKAVSPNTVATVYSPNNDQEQVSSSKDGSEAEIERYIQAIETLEDELCTLREAQDSAQQSLTQLTQEKAILSDRFEQLLKEKRSDILLTYETQISDLEAKNTTTSAEMIDLKMRQMKTESLNKELLERVQRAENELKERDERDLAQISPADETHTLKVQIGQQRKEIVLKSKAATSGWDAAADADQRLDSGVEQAFREGVKEGAQKAEAEWRALNASLESKDQKLSQLLADICQYELLQSQHQATITTLQAQLDAAKLDAADAIASFSSGPLTSGGNGDENSPEYARLQTELDEAQEEIARLGDRSERASESVQLLEDQVRLYEKMIQQYELMQGNAGSSSPLKQPSNAYDNSNSTPTRGAPSALSISTPNPTISTSVVSAADKASFNKAIQLIKAAVNKVRMYIL